MTANHVDAKQKEIETTFRKYAWDYFAVHAAQRLTGFQFFITLATALVGGYLVLIANSDNRKLASIVGFLLVFFSFVFFKLDQRTRALIKNAERALDELDAGHELSDDTQGAPSHLRLFSSDEFQNRQNPTMNPFKMRFSYSRCFSSVFLCFSIIGLFAAIYSLVVPPTNVIAKDGRSSVLVVYEKQADDQTVSQPTTDTPEHDHDVERGSNAAKTSHDRKRRN